MSKCYRDADAVAASAFMDEADHGLPKVDSCPPMPSVKPPKEDKDCSSCAQLKDDNELLERTISSLTMSYDILLEDHKELIKLIKELKAIVKED